MKTTHLLLVMTGLLFVLGCGECFDATDTNTCLTTPATSCDVGTARRSDELIISLRDGIDTTDLLNPISGTKYICWSSTPDPDIGDYPMLTIKEDSTGMGDCDSVLVVTTGIAALKAELEGLLSTPGKPVSLGEIKIKKKCNCDLILLETTLPSNVDLNNGVAGSTTKTKKQDNGMLGSIGFNYDIDPGPIASTPILPAFNPPTDCVKYYYIDTTDQDEVDEVLRVVANLEECNYQIIHAPGFLPAVNTEKTVKVAIVDTGVDPFYGYAGKSPTQDIYNPSYYLNPGSVAELMRGGSSERVRYGSPLGGDDLPNSTACVNDDFYGYDYFHNDNNPSDAQGHGTHIAGIVMTGEDDGTSQIKIIPLQFGGYSVVGDTSSSFECDLFAGICAIDYATKNQADIINLSWGYYADERNETLERQLYLAGKAGALIVASTGNDAKNIDVCEHWPSNFTALFPNNMIAVAALDSLRSNGTMGIAPYSNTGRIADLAAPGTMIEGAMVGTGNGYIELSGTSMAAGVISRRAAMLKYTPGQSRGLTASQLKQQILNETEQDILICTNNNRKYRMATDPTLRSAIGYIP